MHELSPVVRPLDFAGALAVVHAAVLTSCADRPLSDPAKLVALDAIAVLQAGR